MSTRSSRRTTERWARTRLRRLGVVCARGIVLLAVATTIACGNPGDEALDALVTGTEALVTLLETHRGDPEAARAALDAFEAQHGPALDALAHEVSRLQRELTASDRRALRARWDAARARLTVRLEALDAAR